MKTAHKLTDIEIRDKMYNTPKSGGQLKLFNDETFCNSPLCIYCKRLKSSKISTSNLDTKIENKVESETFDNSFKSSATENIKILKSILESANIRFLRNYPNLRSDNDPKPAA